MWNCDLESVAGKNRKKTKIVYIEKDSKCNVTIQRRKKEYMHSNVFPRKVCKANMPEILNFGDFGDRLKCLRDWDSSKGLTVDWLSE